MEMTPLLNLYHKRGRFYISLFQNFYLFYLRTISIEHLTISLDYESVINDTL